MSNNQRSSASYAYYSFPPTPNRDSPPTSSNPNTQANTPSPQTARTSKTMAPSPAAGKTPKAPTTPTKQGKNPASNATSKLSQASSADETPAKDAPKSASNTPKLGKSPKLPPRPKDGGQKAPKLPSKAEEAKDKAEDTTEDAKGKAEETSDEAKKTGGDVTDEAEGKIQMDDNDPSPSEDADNEATDTPQGKVSQPGNETGAEDSAVDDVEDDTEDAGAGAKETAEGEETEGADDTAGDATQQASDTAGGLAGKVGDTAGKTTDNAEDTAGKAADGDAAGVADNVKGTGEDTVGDAKDTADDTAEGAKDTADDTVEGAKDTADETTEGAKDAAPDEAGETADGVKATADDVKDDAEEKVDDAKDTAEETADGVKDEAEGAVDDAKDTAEDAADQVPVDLSVLKGGEVQENGDITGPDGDVIGHLDEGDAEQLKGMSIGDNGEILDEDGDPIGRASVLPEKAEELAKRSLPDISVLKGLQVSEGGNILDSDGNVLGKITEGDPDDLVGQELNEEGEILDEDGDAIGRAEVVPGAAADKINAAQQEAQDKVEEAADAADALPDVGVLEGMKIGEDGDILNAEGDTLGKVVDGDAKEMGEAKINDQGEIVNADGDVIGTAEVVPGDAADKLNEQAEKLRPDLSILAGKKINKKGNILDEEGETIGKLTEDSDLSACAGKIPNEAGEILNDDGEVIGHVEIVEGDAANDAMKDLHPELVEDTKDAAEEAADVPDLSILDGLKVNKKGQVLDEDGEPIAQVSEGEIADLAGKKINDKGEVLDKDGNVIGKVELIPKEGEGEGEEEGEAEPELPPISTLEGLKCNKQGKIVDENGNPVGELVEGDPKKLAKLGCTLDEEGQFWDGKGHVIGRAVTLPIKDADEEAPFAGLEGLQVVEDGWVKDENDNIVGRLVEGDAKKLLGRAVDEDGDILDKNGNAVGRAERYEPEEEEITPPDLSILKGCILNKAGLVVGPEGLPIGRLVEGNAKELAGKACDEEGQIWNDSGKVIGRCEVIPEEEREKKPEGPFAGLEGCVVVKDGFVEDEEGNRVGVVVEGEPKKLIGRAVDDDGDIVDKYGNVKGHAEPYEEPEEPPVDLSILDGKIVNKQGNVVDEHGMIYGRLIDGDPKSLAGRKTDGQGQVWGDRGDVIGHAELIPENERQKPEGPFSGFESVTVGKEGMCLDQAENIVGRVIEGDIEKLQGRKVDTDGDILDSSGNVLGKAERYTPPEKERQINPMAGYKVNNDGEVRDDSGNLIGKLTEGNLGTCIGKEIDDNGYVVDNDGNRVGECTLLENIAEDELTEDELKKLEDEKIAKQMNQILTQTLERIDPVLKNITEVSKSSPSSHYISLTCFFSGSKRQTGRPRTSLMRSNSYRMSSPCLRKAVVYCKNAMVPFAGLILTDTSPPTQRHAQPLVKPHLKSTGSQRTSRNSPVMLSKPSTTRRRRSPTCPMRRKASILCGVCSLNHCSKSSLPWASYSAVF